MRSLNSTARELLIATTAVLSGATLPAAEPQAPETQARQSAEKSPAAPKEWTSALIYKEIGAVEARVSSIEQFFKNHPEQKAEAATWRQKRAEVERFSKEADKQMAGSPPAELRTILGNGLAAVNTSLSLYNDHLSSLNTKPETTPRGTTAGDGVMGIYDVGDMEGLKTSATIFRSLLQGQHARNGTTPDATQQMILNGLSEIESASNPRDLAEKLRPTAVKIVTGLADQKGPGAEGLRDSLRSMLVQTKPDNGGLGGGATPRAERPAVAGDMATAWKSAWDERVKNSRQLHRSAREINCFRDLANDPDGLKMITQGAGKLLEYIKENRKEEKDLIKQLDIISKATDADGVLKSGFSSLHAMQRATGLYQLAAPAAPKNKPAGK